MSGKAFRFLFFNNKQFTFKCSWIFKLLSPLFFKCLLPASVLFVMTSRFICALTEVPSVALPSPSGFCQSGVLTGFAIVKSRYCVKFFCTFSDAESSPWNDCRSLHSSLSKNCSDLKSQTAPCFPLPPPAANCSEAAF